MAWPKGKPRPESAGRKRGTPNKNTLSLIEKCESRGIDVFDAMLELAMESVQPFEKFKMLQEIAQYILPKRKAIEMTGEVDLELKRKVEEYEAMSLDEHIKLLESELKRLKGS
jgi:hypothetical protein